MPDDLGRSACTREQLEKMPVFVARHPAELTPETLHPSYRPRASVYELSLNGRAFKALEALGVRTVGELVTTPRERLMDQWGFGPRSLGILHDELRRFLLDRAGQSAPGVDLSSFSQLVRSLIRLTSPEPRDRDVLEKRLGLDDAGIWSLGRLAEKYGLTRERIRQIESANLETMALRARREVFADLWQHVLDVVTEAGRRCTLDYAAGEVTHRLRWPRRPNRKALAKVLDLHPEIRADIRSGTVQRW
ncbi:MAG: hypothetical protein KGY99_08440 [Phycisphaerae bacterium]|nr:hypothetical protein [Phycisphaerae bacterium]